ncbi:MAG: hypothetical protein V5A59_14535, partial [Bacteroidales bacterium]
KKHDTENEIHHRKLIEPFLYFFLYFAGEQEDDNHLMKPESGVDERGLLYIQQDVEDEERPKFELQVIHEGNPGWHDTQAGDVDKDGDIDLVTKIWNADEGVYHADFWENKLN